ncbi:MAG: hypothetical protein JRI65_14395 [Deltaproteobacteria bacterium]|nr:hypothetical protein [Deltaproteobacteria bacterium]
MLHQPHYYIKNADETEAKLNVVKNRNGPTSYEDLV